MIKRINQIFRLTADESDREIIERVLEVYADSLPVAASVKGSIEISSELDLIGRLNPLRAYGSVFWLKIKPRSSSPKSDAVLTSPASISMLFRYWRRSTSPPLEGLRG